MSLTQEAISSLKAKIEPRDPTTITETGLAKLANGTLIARHSTKEGFRDADEVQQAINNDADMVAELEALREQQEAKPKKKGRKKAAEALAPVAQPKPPEAKAVTVRLDGIGEIPTQYANINFGENGVALLGLTKMSFIPKITDPTSDEPPTLFELSPRPGTKFVYLGNTVTLDNGVKQLVIYEAPEEE